jgi:3-oxoacyl-[acyl-carrier protein] reductase
MQEKKQVAIVTGGSKGIGQAICIELASCGYEVVINYRSDHDGAQKTLGMIEALGSTGRLACFDVRDAESSQKTLEALAQEYDTLDVLVNNAGVADDNLFVMMPRRSWDRVIRTSLDGFYNITKPVLEKMVVNKHGSIVTISSVSGLMANRGQSNYSAAKSGLIGASRTLSAEVARLGVRVNVVAPGMIETEMLADVPRRNLKQIIPMARIGKPEEVAKVVRFLCSDDASYITGQVIGVNGGMV